MDRRVLLGMALTLAFSTFPLPASAQAIAESVSLGAGSSTAAVKAGSALNSALNQSSKRFAGGIRQQLSQPPQTNTQQSGKNSLPKGQSSGTAIGNIPQPGAMIAFIQGAEGNCPPTNEKPSTHQGKAAAEPPSTNCISQSTSVKSGSQKYKSMVTLSFPK
jgi:hypothetical protein